GDVVAGAFQGHALGETDDSRLGRGIAGLPETADGSGDGGHVDDPPPVLLLHDRPDRLGAVVGPRQVHPQIPFPELVILVLDAGDVVQGGGVVDKDVDAAHLFLHFLEYLVHLVAVGDVHPDGHRTAPHFADLFRRFFGVDDPGR